MNVSRPTPRRRWPLAPVVFIACALSALASDRAAAGSRERGGVTSSTSNRPPAVVVDSEALIRPVTGTTSFAGAAVAIVGNLALVGVPGRDGGGTGTVYAYSRLGRAWASVPDQRIDNPNATGATDDNFGASIAIAGNFAVIGAPGGMPGGEAGAAYLYEYDASAPLASRWSRVAAALPRPSGGPSRFGASVAISDRWVVVGAPGSGSTILGAAYVYETPFTGPATALVIPTASADDLVGASVAVDGDAILVGAPGFDAPVTDAGAVFAYDYVGASWGTATTLLTDASARADFGASVALSNGGTRALVGSPYDSDRASSAGAVFLYDRAAASAWPAAGRRITASDGRASDYFGTAVALAGDDAVVGAPLHDENGAAAGDDTGSVYLLTGTMLDEIARFRSTARTGRDHLGAAVAFAGDTVLGGAPDSLPEMMVGYVASFRVPQIDGAECAVEGDCASGFCFNLGATGVCCAEACLGDCESCNATTGICEAANAGGTCMAGGMCSAGTCSGRVCESPGCDAGPGDAGEIGLDAPLPDAGPRLRVRISGCRCGVGVATASPGALAGLVALGAVLSTRRRRR